MERKDIITILLLIGLVALFFTLTSLSIYDMTEPQFHITPLPGGRANITVTAKRVTIKTFGELPVYQKLDGPTWGSMFGRCKGEYVSVKRRGRLYNFHELFPEYADKWRDMTRKELVELVHQKYHDYNFRIDCEKGEWECARPIEDVDYKELAVFTPDDFSYDYITSSGSSIYGAYASKIVKLVGEPGENATLFIWRWREWSDDKFSRYKIPPSMHDYGSKCGNFTLSRRTTHLIVTLPILRGDEEPTDEDVVVNEWKSPIDPTIFSVVFLAVFSLIAFLHRDSIKKLLGY